MKDFTTFTDTVTDKKFAVRQFDIRRIEEIDNKSTLILVDPWEYDEDKRMPLLKIPVVGSFEDTIGKLNP